MSLLCAVQVVAEWELFLLTSVAYEKSVRAAARAKLVAIQARDEARLVQLHEVVSQGVMALDTTALTALPTPQPSKRLDPCGFRPVCWRSLQGRRATHRDYFCHCFCNCVCTNV